MAASNQNFDTIFALPESLFPERFQTYRLMGKFIDVSLIVGEESFGAHRKVLEDSSPVFKARLSDNKVTNSVLKLKELKNVPKKIVEDLLTFLYLSKITLTPENVHGLYTASRYLEIPSLLSACEKYLHKTIIPSTIWHSYCLAIVFELDSLRKKCIEMVIVYQAHDNDLLKDDFLWRLSERKMKILVRDLMEDAEYYENNKTLILQMLRSWSEHDLPKRSKLFKEFQSSLLGLSQEGSPAQTSWPTNYLYSLRYQNQRTSIHRLNTTTKESELLKTIPMNECDFGIATIRSEIYLCGGMYKKRASNRLFVYDFITGSETELPSMPDCRYLPGVAFLNSSIFVAGGRDQSKKKISTVLKYKIKTKKWDYVERLKNICGDLQLVVLDGKLHALGGNGTTKLKFECHTTCQNKNMNKWISLPEPSHDEYSVFRAVVFQKNLYLYGQNSEKEDQFEVYSLETETWERLPLLRNFRSCEYRSLTVVGRRIYAISIEDDEEIETFSFNPFEKTWSKLPEMENEQWANSIYNFTHSEKYHSILNASIIGKEKEN